MAWVSLDPADNDPLRFLAYLTTSIDAALPGLIRSTVDLLQSSRPPDLGIITSSLVAALNALPGDLIVVLDDYHAITNLAVHDLLNELLAQASPCLHLVILTRVDPPLPLARLRVSNALTEIRAGDLRFTVDEGAAFLSQTMGLSLSREQIALLETRTEGWIAGLQLAALSMRGRQDVDDFLAAFTGSHHYVVDYLVEEVLGRQSEKTRDFLLKTSILERMTAPLCNTLTGDPDGQATLAELERANLFIVNLDSDRQWYRYHHLFGEVLRQRSLDSDPEGVKELHRRASGWMEQNGFLQDAVRHALAGGDRERAGLLLETMASQMLCRGELVALLGQLEVLEIPPLDRLLVVLFVRSVLFFLACLPIMIAWQGSGVSLFWRLGLALFYLVGFQPLLIASWMPWSLRLPHMIEILLDEFVYAGTLAGLMGTGGTEQQILHGAEREKHEYTPDSRIGKRI